MNKTLSLSRNAALLLCLFFIGLMVVACGQQTTPTPAPEMVVTATEISEEVSETIPPSAPQPLLLINEQVQSPQKIGVNHLFLFSFNQPVDRGSFEENFTLQPSVKGEFQWEDDVTVVFAPNSSLVLGTHYTVEIDTNVYAQNGPLLSTSVIQNFITTSPLVLTSQYPSDQASELDIHTPIWVTFNQPVVESIGAESPIPFTIEPAIPGSGRWANVSTYIFYPSEELVSNTTYSIQFNSNMDSQYGTTYESLPVSTFFTTEGPQVVSVTPQDLSTLEPEQNIIISFNQEMDQESVVANLRLEDKDAKVIVPDYLWNDSSTQLTIQGGDYFFRSNTVLVVLNPAAKTRTGVPLNESLRIQYATLPIFDIDVLPPSSIDVQPSGYAQLSFHSNVPLDPEQDFLGLIDVRNKIPGEFTAILDETGKNLTYTGFFIPGTFYSYSLSPDLHDQWGQPLGKTVFKRFATKSAPAAILLNQHDVPPSHLFFPLSDIQVPVETTNIRRVDMQSIALSIEEYIKLYCDYSDCLQFNEFAFTRFWYQSIYPYIVNAPVPSELTMAPRFRTLDSGVYVFDYDSPDLKNRDSLRFFGIVGNTQLTAKQIGDELLIWAVDLETFSPIQNGPIVLYNTDGEVIDGGTTDAHGLLKISDVNPGTVHVGIYQPEHPQFGLISVAVRENVTPDANSLSSVEYFLDRPTYYPGTDVNFLIYPNIDLKEGLTVNLVYSYQGQSNIIDEIFIPNAKGNGLQGDFRIPESLPLGTYSIELAGHGISHPILVAEKETSKANIDITFDQEIIQYGEEVNGHIDVLADEKVPVPGQKVNWTASILPSIGEYRGSCITDDTGSCSFSLPIGIFDSLSQLETYTLSLNAFSDILSTSSSQSCLISPAKFIISIQPETWLGQAGEVFGVEILSLTSALEVVPSIDLDARFEKINFIDTPAFVDGKEIITSQIQGAQIASTAFSTDENGYARLTFTPPDTGVYRITVHKGDFSQESWVYVNGIQPGEWLEEGINLLTISDKQTALPGETVQVYLPNPFVSTTTVLVTIQNQSEYRHQVVTIDESSGKIIDLAIKESDMPLAHISMTFVGLEEDGKVGVRESELEISVEEELPKLTIESGMEFTQNGKGLFRIAVTDESNAPVQATYSLLVLPTDWVSQQPESTTFFKENLAQVFRTLSDNSLDTYIRRNGWKTPEITPTAVNDVDLLPKMGIPFTGADTIFLANLNTSNDGSSFIEFPFSPENTSYTYYVVAMDSAGLTGFQQTEVAFPEEQNISSRRDNLVTFSNVLASTGQEIILIPIPYGNENQKWDVELFGDDLTAIQSFSNGPAVNDKQPVTIASGMLRTYALNGLYSNSHSIDPYIALLESTQNGEGGWGYLVNDDSVDNLTYFITYALLESGAISMMEVGNLDRSTEYLQNKIATESPSNIWNQFLLQSITLEYQELADFVDQYTALPIVEQIVLTLALAQQSNTETIQNEILTTLQGNVLYDEFGAYLPGDKTEEIWRSEESMTALLLFTLGQLQPDSELTPALRSWLIHQGLTNNLSSNPVAHSLALLALQRTAHTVHSEDFGVQVIFNSETSRQMNASDFSQGQSFLETIEIDALTPSVAVIHQEGDGNLYYRISAATPNIRAITNGIQLSRSFFPVGKSCRPGNCIPQSDITFSEATDLIEAHLVITVGEDLQHVILTLPGSEQFEIHTTSEVFDKLLPPLESPLEYGFGLEYFVSTEIDGKTQLYAKTLPAGTYEIIYYAEVFDGGTIAMDPIMAYHLFNDTLYALSEPGAIIITLEKPNE